MSDIVFRCTHCSRSLQIDGAHAGAQISCPHCSQSLIVPHYSRVSQVRIESLSPARPTFITVLSLLNIVLGSMGLLCMPLLLAVAMLPTDIFSIQAIPQSWRIFSTATLPVMSLWLLITGIGLLKLRKWARISAVSYGWFTVVLGTAQLCIIIAEYLTNLQQPPFGSGPNYVAEATSSMVGSILSGFVALAYPVILIIFLSRRQATTACSR
jgi:hypothetical protein